MDSGGRSFDLSSWGLGLPSVSEAASSVCILTPTTLCSGMLPVKLQKEWKGKAKCSHSAASDLPASHLGCVHGNVDKRIED